MGNNKIKNTTQTFVKKMIFLVFVLLLLVNGKTILRETYDGPRDDNWLKIKLAVPNDPHLVHVEWCSELYKGASSDINDCKAHNLVRKTIYPPKSVNENVIDLVTLPGYMRLNSDAISGFWLNRQADIVIEMKNGHEDRIIVQVVRLNPSSSSQLKEKEEEEVVEAKHAVVTNPPPTTGGGGGEPPVMGTGLLPSTTSKVVHFPSIGMGPVIVSGLAIAAMLLVIALVLLRSDKKLKHTEEPKILSSVYQFETNSGVNLLLSDEDEEKHQQQVKKDQAFLLSLAGNKVDEAFFLNIK